MSSNPRVWGTMIVKRVVEAGSSGTVRSLVFGTLSVGMCYCISVYVQAFIILFMPHFVICFFTLSYSFTVYDVVI